MKSLSCLISRKAFQDLDSIWTYSYKKWSRVQTDRYYTPLIKEIEFIGENFKSGESRSFIKDGYRVHKAQSHAILYKKNQKGQIEIIMELYQKMDVESSL